MPMNNLFKVSQTDRYKFCDHLIETSSPKTDFYFLVIISTLIVALGLVADNVILVIGGMLVTPLLSPILALAMGILINEYKVISRSIKIFGLSFFYAFLVAFILGIITNVNVSEIGLISMMRPSLFVFFVAVVAGLAASYAWAKPGLNDTLPGIAITVTLIPPLTAVGLAIAGRNWPIAGDVIKVLLLNVFGIIVASLVVFSFMEFYRAKNKIIAEVKKEEKEILLEKKKIETAVK
jgi:uncharacterized hydrophobic protein (TIGR00271 family)